MKNDYKIGEKIKDKRIAMGLTQAEVAGDKMTRNMLSLIENGKTMPSIDSIIYLSEKLGITPAYLFSTEDDAFIHRKNVHIGRIKELYEKEDFCACIELIQSLGMEDDELNYICARAAFAYAKRLVLVGSLISAGAYIPLARRMAASTVYPTTDIELFLPMYEALVNNIEAPLLELDTSAISDALTTSYDLEFFNYICSDPTYDYKTPIFKLHLDAKRLLKKYSYADAIEVLARIEAMKSAEMYNAAVMLAVYADLEYAYKQMGDFENAYRYSTKRMSMITGFKS